MFKHFFRYLLLICFATANLSLAASEIKIAYFSQDPPSIDPLSPSFDPDSYAVISQVFDTLVYMDLDGQFKPGLATSWQNISPTRWKFILRKDVKFHNGEHFDANSVKFTFEYILNKKNNSGNAWIFNTLKRVIVNPKNLYEIVLETHHPDGMFLNRLNLFGSVCPPLYIKEKGIAHFQKHPIGTGPFKFNNWIKGQQISLAKNPDYWLSGIPYLDQVSFIISDQLNWVDHFMEGKIDLIPNLAGNKTTEFLRRANNQAKIIKREVLFSYAVLLKNKGVLADVSVRKALNHAINKTDLIHIADFGNALPLASLGKRGEFGANPQLQPYLFNQDKARLLLRQSLGEDYANAPPVLNALVADVAENAAKVIQKNLLDVGIILNIEVVSRSQWTKRIVVHKMMTGKRADYDVAINLVDNPIYNFAFHAGLFLNSSSPWALLESSEFDQLFKEALIQSDVTQHRIKLEQLDEYIHNQALMLFTTQKILTAAVRRNIDIDVFGANGHLDYEVLSRAQVIDLK